MPDNIATQLRSLAVENRAKADFFEIAADLHEQGYQSDIEAAKLALAPQIAQLESDKHSLTEILNIKEEEHAGVIAAKNLELENATARIAELETQLGIKEPTPAEEGGGVG